MEPPPLPQPGPAERLRFWLEKGRHDRASEEGLRLLAEDPENPELHRLLGVSFWTLGERKNARFHLQEAVRLDPDDPVTQEVLALTRLSVFGSQRADGHALAALAVNPDSVPAWQALASSSLADDPAFSIRSCRRILALDPDNTEARILLANALAVLEKPSDWRVEAERVLREALQLSPEDAMVHAAVGNFLIDYGSRRSEGRGHLREALRLDPGNELSSCWRIDASGGGDWLLKLLELPKVVCLKIITGATNLIQKHFLLLLLAKLYLILVFSCLAGLVLWACFLWPPSLFYRRYVILGNLIRARATVSKWPWTRHLIPRAKWLKVLAAFAVTLAWIPTPLLLIALATRVDHRLSGGNLLASATLMVAALAFLFALWLGIRAHLRRRKMRGVD